MTLREALSMGTRRLTEAGIQGAPRDARALLAEAAGISADRVLLEGDLTLSDPETFVAMISRRINGEPVSKILGRRLFWGRSFSITRDTLDPRPETECLIAAALELGPVADFADLGTGSGIIAVTLLAEWPDAHAVATDASPAAISVASRNSEVHKVLDRLAFLQPEAPTTWFPDGLGRFDMILSNPPYITMEEMGALSREVYDHDPHMALTPGGDGLDAYRAIASGAKAHLNETGKVLVEIGHTQGAAVVNLFKEAGFGRVRCLPDLDGRDRVVVAEMP